MKRKKSYITIRPNEEDYQCREYKILNPYDHENFIDENGELDIDAMYEADLAFQHDLWFG